MTPMEIAIESGKRTTALLRNLGYAAEADDLAERNEAFLRDLGLLNAAVTTSRRGLWPRLLHRLRLT